VIFCIDVIQEFGDPHFFQIIVGRTGFGDFHSLGGISDGTGEVWQDGFGSNLSEILSSTHPPQAGLAS
jgi:hypothetical protein